MHFLLLLTLLAAQQSATKSPAKLMKELASQHFSGALDGKVKFTTLGRLSCGRDSLQVVFYEWEASSSPGLAVHASYRIILMNGAIYLGSYAVEDRPRILRNELKFPYKQYGNSIRCSIDGPPREVLLSGENISLAK